MPTNPWPPGYETVLVTGRFFDLAGHPLAGRTISFTAPTQLVDQVNNRIIAPFKVTFTLDQAGEMAAYMLATDEPDIIPKNWTYEVKFNYPGGAVSHISVPVGSGTVDLADLVDVPVSAGDPTTYATVEMLAGEKAEREAADALLIPLAQKGAPNGVATLGSDGKVSPSQLNDPVFPPMEFSQAIPSATWTITHPYAYEPEVSVLNNAREVVFATVSYPTSSTVSIHFAGAETGYAILQ